MAETIDLILDGEPMELVPTMFAAQKLSDKYNGLLVLCDLINGGSFGAITDVLWYGLGANAGERADLAKKVYEAGLSKLAPKLVRYIVLLANGGRSDG